jgi:hypothetical protein
MRLCEAALGNWSERDEVQSNCTAEKNDRNVCIAGDTSILTFSAFNNSMVSSFQPLPQERLYKLHWVSQGL